MPPEGALDTQTLQAVYDWIATGASEECEEATTTSTTSTHSPPVIENNDYCDVVNAFEYYCLNCHSAKYAKYYADLDLETDVWTAVVDAPSTQYMGTDLVVPGSSKDSLLWTKVAGVQGAAFGDQMPGVLMPQEYIDLVAVWIDNGATAVCGGTN